MKANTPNSTPTTLREKKTTAQRFWEKVQKTDGCWLWTGCINPQGYGRFYYKGKKEPAQRVSLILAGVEVPPKLHTDHLCRNHACVNPDHLEVVTHRENIIRGKSSALNENKGWCKRGHQLNDENSYITYARGREERSCKKCSRRRYEKRRKEHEYN